MAEEKTWTGSCHCGAVRYTATTDLSQVITCNCSMCQRAGTILTFVPAAKFELLQGQDDLTEYRFNKHVIQHLFCKHCGIKPFARGKTPDGKGEVAAVNVRCLEGVDLDALKPIHFDGRSR